MTAPARIPQLDVERIAKGVREAGYAPVRIVVDLANQKIEFIFDEKAADLPPAGWGEDDD